MVAFDSVDHINASSSASFTPTLTDLQAYDAVLAFSTATFDDPIALGNVLADYYDGGGRVVTAFATATSSLPRAIEGRFGSDYMLLDNSGGFSGNDDSLGTIFEPSSPLLAGVSSLSAGWAYQSTGGLANGGITVAEWNDSGEPLVIRGEIGNRQRVDLNFYPISSEINSNFWTGDGFILMANALLYE